MSNQTLIRTEIDRGERARAHYVAKSLGVTVTKVYSALIRVALSDYDGLDELCAVIGKHVGRGLQDDQN